MKLNKAILEHIVTEELNKLNETDVRLSTYKDASFEPGRYVAILGKNARVKLDKRSVHKLAKIVRNMAGKHGMGWSFTEDRITEATNVTLPNGVKVKIEFNGLTFQSSTGKVFFDRGEMLKFFQATSKYLR